MSFFFLLVKDHVLKMIKKISICFILSVLLALGSCGRSDLVRIRMMAPLSEANKDHAIFSDKTSAASSTTTSKEPSTTGGSLYLLASSIGIGYSTLSTTIQKEVRNTATNALILKEKTTLKTTFTDLAFSTGQDFTLMWGVGAVSGGTLTTDLSYGYSGASDESLEGTYVGGHSTFLILGHHGHGFETLLGIRNNDIKAEIDLTGTSAKTLKTAGSIDYENPGLRFKTSQVILGIGWAF